MEVCPPGRFQFFRILLAFGRLVSVFCTNSGSLSVSVAEDLLSRPCLFQGQLGAAVDLFCLSPAKQGDAFKGSFRECFFLSNGVVSNIEVELLNFIIEERVEGKFVISDYLVHYRICAHDWLNIFETDFKPIGGDILIHLSLDLIY